MNIGVRETVNNIKDIEEKIKITAFHYNQMEKKEDTVRYLRSIKEDEGTGEFEVNRLNSLRSIVIEREAENLKQNTKYKDGRNKLEKLNEEKASIETRIQSLQNQLKQIDVHPEQGSKQKLQEKRDCVLAWKLLTNTEFDYSSTSISGYHYNPTNSSYKVFRIDPKSHQPSDKLWTVISENSTNNE